MWFKNFFNKHQDSFEIVTTEVPKSTLIRWYLHDMAIENSNDMAKIFGLTPISDEGAGKEEEDSDSRLLKLDGFLPFIEVMADINARVVAQLQAEIMKEDGEALNQEAIDDLVGFHTAVSISALVPAFASAIEIGMIIPTAIKSYVDYQEKPYEQ
jgi:hypothetical protein